MSSSTRAIRFLLDENVRSDVDRFFEVQRIDTKRLPKGISDQEIAICSRKERRVVVTNDEDFVLLPPKKVYSVVWLRIPQSDAAGLRTALERLLNECRDWKGRCIELSLPGWSSSALGDRRGHAA